MSDLELFVQAAGREGYSADAARKALAAVRARLAERGSASGRYFCFRSGGTGAGAGGGGAPPARPRLLLVFPSADDALGFAQRSGLGASPRLMALSLGQALATLVQRPTIGALLVADPEGHEPGAASGALPPGLRLGRAELIALLDEASL